MSLLGSQSLNTTRQYAIDLGGPGSGSLGSSLLGLFTGSETFAAKLWPGGAYPTSAVLLAGWDSAPGNPAALPHPVVRLSVTAAAIAGLAPGTYAAQVVINPGVDDIEAWEGWIELTAAGGSAPLPLVYGTPQDLLDEADWADSLQDLGPGAATQFLRQRKLAAEWLHRQVLARHERDLDDQARRHAPMAASAPIRPTAGYDAGPSWGPSSIPDTTRRDALGAMRARLEGGMLVAEAGAVRLAALWALHLICRAQAGRQQGDTPYQALARQYRRDAIRGLCGWTARLDADGDGVAEWELAP